LRNDSARYAATQINGVRWPESVPVTPTGPSVATVNTASIAQGLRTGFDA